MEAATTSGTFPPEEFPPLHGYDKIKPQQIGNGNQNILQYTQILQTKTNEPTNTQSTSQTSGHAIERT